jgi:hypothetical protein
MLPALRALLALLVLGTIAGLVAPRSKLVAHTCGAAAFLVVPWLAGPIPLVRALCTIAGFMGWFRVTDVVRSGATWNAPRRVFQVLSPIDARTLRRERPRVDLAALGGALAWLALAAFGLWLAFVVPSTPRWLARWGGGLLCAYGAVDAGYALIGFLYRLGGLAPPPLHVWPVASLSVGELWGVRWARPVSGWLREHCLVPFARRRRPMLGLALAFVVSAIGHAYLVLVAVDVPMAVMMFGYFALQGAFATLEARLGTARWRPAARRVWTVSIMVASSPLFLEPFLRILA